MNRTTFRFAPLLPLSLACAGCGPEQQTAPAPIHAPSSAAPTDAQEPLDPAASPPSPIAPGRERDVPALARAINAFALDLYAACRAEKGNFVMSPFSVATALLMALSGARGETATEIQRVLHLDVSPDQAVDAAGAMLERHGGGGFAPALRVANRLFGDRAAEFDRGYTERLERALRSGLEALDFRGAPEPARQRINAWVAEATKGRIRDLVPEGAISTDTRLVLANAIHFLADWAIPFDPRSTTPRPFFTAPRADKRVPTMRGTRVAGYAVAKGVRVLELGYRRDALAMTFVLPEKVDGLDALEARLAPALLDAWTSALAPREVLVALPRFTIDPASSLSLGRVLDGLGMRLAFDRAHADFTGIADPADPEERLSIADVFHKAFVRVDEKGTEAAAATAIPMVLAAGAVVHAKPPEFRADHPFLFLLRDVRSGAILFMGRVADPTAG